MNNKTKTTLRFFLGALLVVSFAVTGCNNGGEAEKTTVKDSAVKEITPVMPPVVKDSMDTMKGNVSPTPGGN